jgi:hypothetical protein
MPFVLGTVFPESLLQNILRHFLVEPCSTYDVYRKVHYWTVYRHTEQ